MELNEFITQVLCKILDGISAAKTITTKKYDDNCLISPGHHNGQPVEKDYELINFDILISTETSASKGVNGGAKISVLNLGVGGDYNKKSVETKAHRINFNVPYMPFGVPIKKD